MSSAIAGFPSTRGTPRASAPSSVRTLPPTVVLTEWLTLDPFVVLMPADPPNRPPPLVVVSNWCTRGSNSP
ncbi:hypothetical protein HFP72_27395 [Nocardiopsis sp. ARC36]